MSEATEQIEGALTGEAPRGIPQQICSHGNLESMCLACASMGQDGAMLQPIETLDCARPTGDAMLLALMKLRTSQAVGLQCRWGGIGATTGCTKGDSQVAAFHCAACARCL